MKLKAFSLVLVLLLLGCSDKENNNIESMLAEEDFIKIAREAAVELEYSLETAIIYCDANNIEWNSYYEIIKNEDKDSYNWVKKKIKNKNYQAVHIMAGPIGTVLDGAFWVLIDRKTGKVLGGIQG